MSSRPIYLDYNATTPVDARVFEAMIPYFSEKFGNPSSATHVYGWEAEKAVDDARTFIAKALGAGDKRSVVFTSGATEANNLAILGLAKHAPKNSHFITQKTEHRAVLEPFKQLESEGHRVSFLEVDGEGLVNPDDVARELTDQTVLCSIMTANNEIGTIQPVTSIAAICQKRGVPFHTDAAQSLGRLDVNMEQGGIDALSFSSHKIYGPKGVGALVIRRRKPPVSLAPLLVGGGHERGLRAGTLNVPGIVGMAKALELCLEERESEQKRLQKLRDDFIAGILKVGNVVLNGSATQRLAGNINLSFLGIKSGDLILKTQEIAISSSSACSSGETKPSHVLSAITTNTARLESAIRLGLGRFTTPTDMQTALDCLTRVVSNLRLSKG